MKIYTRVVIDIATGEIKEEESFDYSGPIAKCGGGGGVPEPSSEEKEYYSAMADIAETQQMIASEYFDFWRTDYKPLEEAQIATATKEAKVAKKVLGYEKRMLPVRYGLEREQLEAERAILPARYGLEEATIAQERGILPARYGAEAAELGLAAQKATGKIPLVQAMYKQALEGIDIEKRAAEAQAGVQHAASLTQEQLIRQAGRLGIDPASGAFAQMLGYSGMEQAKGIAGARAEATRLAEEEQFKRLGIAISL